MKDVTETFLQVTAAILTPVENQSDQEYLNNIDLFFALSARSNYLCVSNTFVLACCRSQEKEKNATFFSKKLTVLTT